MGMHTGEAEEHDGTYFGHSVNVAARLMAAAVGGQIIVSEVTTAVIGDVTAAEFVDWVDSACAGWSTPWGRRASRPTGWRQSISPSAFVTPLSAGCRTRRRHGVGR